MSGCMLPWGCSLARVSTVFQIAAVPIFPQDPASFSMREAFPREICAEDCFQTGAGKNGTANSPSAKNTHCGGCEVSPRQMGGGTFLPSLPCSCLNWGNLQSGAKLWKSCGKAASSPPPAWPAGRKHTTSSSSLLPSVSRVGTVRDSRASCSSGEGMPRVTAGQAGPCPHQGGCSATVPEPGKRADLDRS